MLSRRHMLKLSSALAVAGAWTPASLLSAAEKAGAPDPFKADLAAFADEMIRLAPEQVTYLGLEKGKYAALKSQLSDVSIAFDANWLHEARSIRERLNKLDRTKLPQPDQARYDAVAFSADCAIDGAKFPYGYGVAGGLQGGAQPYVINQQSGALTSVPEFLDSQHQIHDKADAEAYLARVSAFATQLNQENERIRADAGKGVAPPDFIAATVMSQLKEFRAVAADKQRLVESLAAKTAKANIPGDWAKRCAKIMDAEVYPALDKQIQAFGEATANPAPGAGVQRLPDGDALYAWALRLGTTTNATPEEVHRLGLEQNAEIKSRIDTLLKKQGLTEGSVGERIQALNKDPRFLYPDNDAGRTDLIAYLNECVAKIRPLLPKVSHLGLKAEVQVKRVPVDIQDGAALGYMNFASLDGSRPAIYYVNLKSTSLWPKYQLPTLTAHEGVPGHTWQGAYLAEHHKDIPLISSLTGYNAFVEGWALYAEQLMDELGLYADDPFGEIGYLQAQQFRACRLVADTGLHSMRWSRDQAVKFLSDETGKTVGAMTSETDRYCVAPGQACGYKMGHNEILRLRSKTMAALGQKFDLADFNDVVVKTGGVPLTVLATVVDGYIASKRS